MHPGPVNRGVEIDSEIADCGRSLILEQVTNGLAARMAVLFLLNGGKGPAGSGLNYPHLIDGVITCSIEAETMLKVVP